MMGTNHDVSTTVGHDPEAVERPYLFDHDSRSAVRFIVADLYGRPLGDVYHERVHWTYEARCFDCGRAQSGFGTFDGAVSWIEDDMHEATR